MLVGHSGRVNGAVCIIIAQERNDPKNTFDIARMALKNVEATSISNGVIRGYFGFRRRRIVTGLISYPSCTREEAIRWTIAEINEIVEHLGLGLRVTEWY